VVGDRPSGHNGPHLSQPPAANSATRPSGAGICTSLALGEGRHHGYLGPSGAARQHAGEHSTSCTPTTRSPQNGSEQTLSPGKRKQNHHLSCRTSISSDCRQKNMTTRGCRSRITGGSKPAGIRVPLWCAISRRRSSSALLLLQKHIISHARNARRGHSRGPEGLGLRSSRCTASP
jgi:hypothetical protein